MRRLLITLLALALASASVWLVIRSREPSPPPAPPASTSTAPTREIIGTSVESRSIEAYTYGTGDKEILFVGGIHGGYEWNSVLLAYQAMDYLAANPSAVPKNLKVTIIPNANPDGTFAVIKKEGRFSLADVPAPATAGAGTVPAGTGRFNAHQVDLNRNFDCKWQAESTWRSQPVSAGTAPFSEPEAQAIRGWVLAHRPAAAIFWHSQANAVYASECTAGILPSTLTLMHAYATAAGYPAVSTFDAYTVTGDAEGWLASISIPAITVELQTHETIEWERNLAGIKAVLANYNTN